MSYERSSRSFSDDAVAIVGISCRLPQAPDPDSFWRLLRDGGDAVTGVPGGRWNSPETESLRGGFLTGIAEFDAEFFGISPNEAAMMDPQQRLLMELSWEALEDAGIVPDSLRGTGTSVFIGAMAGDYAQLLQGAGRAALTRHSLTGISRALLANRISYTLGLNGPSLTVDSAQSASLTAVHLACESLRGGESSLAIVGGVNLNLTPDSTLAALRFGALSPDGRCFTFDARANGYVRGEGGGIVVLKPLARALADGDRVHCVIAGSAVNNDGGGDGSPSPTRTPRKRSSGWPASGPACRRPPSSTSSCTAPGPGSATPSRHAPWAPPSAPRRTRARRCSSARPRPTSATWKARRESSACSRPCWPSGTGSCRRRSTSRRPAR